MFMNELNTIVSNGMLGVVKELPEARFRIKWIGRFEKFESFKFMESFNN